MKKVQNQHNRLKAADLAEESPFSPTYAPSDESTPLPFKSRIQFDFASWWEKFGRLQSSVPEKKKKKKNFLKLSELDQINRVISPKSRAGWGLSMIGRGLKQNCGGISSLRALSFYMPGGNEARYMNPLALLWWSEGIGGEFTILLYFKWYILTS